MSTEPGSQSRPSWRSAAPNPGRRRLAAPRWRREGDASLALPTGRTRAWRVILCGGLVLFFGSLLVSVALWFWPPRPACLVLVGAGYHENLAIPHNAYGWNDLAALADTVEGGARTSSHWRRFDMRLLGKPAELKNGVSWDEGLDRLPERTALVVMSLHGAADDDEKGPYLLRDVADPHNAASSRVYVKDVIERLKGLAPRRFVLVLDAAQVPADPTLGFLRNDFALRLRERLTGAIEGAGNLVVICSSDVGQRSWVAEGWRRTAFGYYLAEGLAGRAVDPKAGGRITAESLFEYARDRVEKWAAVNRQALQRPFLLPEKGSRASRIELTLAPDESAPQDSRAPRSLTPDDLRRVRAEEWDRHDASAARSPSPAAAAPQDWRSYRDAVLRLEQLVNAAPAPGLRFDAIPEKVRSLRKTIDALHARLEPSATLPNSARFSLALPAALGVKADAAASDAARFDAFWTADDGDEGRDALRKMVPPSPATPFYQRLLEKVRATSDIDMPATFTRAARRLEVMPTPRPAEAHLLAMILRDRPQPLADPKAYYALVRKALDTRVRAGKAALAAAGDDVSRAEQVAPRVKGVVDEADALRRRAEDLLFADDAGSWAEALALLGRADTLYRQADERARFLREAMDVRDRAFAELPYFVQWACRRVPNRSVAGPDRPPIDLADRIGNACDHAHALSEALLADDQRALDPEPVRTLSGELSELRSWCRGEGQAQLAEKARDWSEVAAGLSTPFLERKQRESLYEALDGLSVRPGDGTALTTPTVEKTQAVADLEAGRWGRLTLRLLGERWAPVPPRGPAAGEAGPNAEVPDTFAPTVTTTDTRSPDTLFLLKTQRVRELIDTRDWFSSGAQLQARWVQLPLAIERWAAAAERSPVGTWPTELANADLLGRLMPGRNEPAVDPPVARLRRRLTHNLYLAEAYRALEDHWYGDTMSGAPYYRLAAEAFLGDVEGSDRPVPADVGKVDPPRAVTELRLALKRAGGLRIVSAGAPQAPAGGGPAEPDVRVVTSEPEIRLQYHVAAPKGAWVPSGTPVVWLGSEGGTAVSLREPEASRRRRMAIPGQSAPEAPGVASAPVAVRAMIPDVASSERALPETGRPEVKTSAVVARGRFRGQILGAQTRVDLHAVPEVVRAEYPPPATGKVAVRADAGLVARFGEGGGALAIVLDCSGSMSAVTGRGADGVSPITKYQEATSALRQVFNRLTRGTQVSLWVFGERLRPLDDTTPAEETIRQVLPPTRWRDDPALVEDVMRRVESPALTPHNETPLVRAMLAAGNDLRNSDGFKTLLVITDGKDNRFAKDAEGNPQKKDVRTAVGDAFRGSDIAIDLVGFRVVSAEEDEIRKQFQVIEELSQPGRFYSVRDGASLARELSRALRPNLQVSVETEVNQLVRTLPVGREGSADGFTRPGLDPGAYKLVADLGGRVERHMTVNRGDALLVRLGQEGGRVTIERTLANDGTYPAVPSADRSWLLSCLRGGLSGPALDRLELWATLEKEVTPNETTMEMIRPREAWFEVDRGPGSEHTPFAQRWTSRTGYPAPFWSVRVSGWPKAAGLPTPSRPQLRAWWDPDKAAPYTTKLVKFADFRSGEEILDREVRVDDLPPITLDGVTVETHRVQTGDDAGGEPVFAEKSCLVVRMTLPQDQRFFVRPIGLKPDGAEHRFYTAANRYTALFWTVTGDQAELNLKGLALVSLTRFKREAQSRGYRADLTTLPAPVATDLGPALLPGDAPPPPLAEALPR